MNLEKRSGLFYSTILHVYTCKWWRFENKVGFILYEDLRLIHYGEYCDQQSERSIATT